MPDTNLRPGTVRDLVDETATNLIELAGVIKWFDVSKGFGFIVPDNGMPDVLLHVTCATSITPPRKPPSQYMR